VHVDHIDYWAEAVKLVVAQCRQDRVLGQLVAHRQARTGMRLDPGAGVTVVLPAVRPPSTPTGR
jgi:hypothetical protein